MKSRPVLICLDGVDGVGKSTQAELLLEKLKENGYKSKYVWMRFHHLFSLPLLACARLAGLSEVKSLDSETKVGYHYFYRSKLVSALYPALQFIDILIYTTANIYLSMFFGTSIVCDRFIYGTLVDLMSSTRNFNLCDERMGKLFLKLIPKNSKVIMLSASENILRGRKAEVEGDETLKLKISLYDKLAHKLDISAINSENSVEDVHLEILKMLGFNHG